MALDGPENLYGKSAFFHLYFDSRTFFLVPKSGCADKDEVAALRGLLHTHIPKQQKGKR